MTEDLWRLDATALVEGYAQGRFSPVEAAAETLARIERLDPQLNVFAFLDQTLGSQAEESAARWKAGAPLGPLDGVPVAIKDNLAASGMPAAWGNAALAERVIERDEAPVARLRAAGALIVGKTGTPEFAVEGYNASLRFGVSRNPFDLALTPGGSSGATAAAVAAGLVAAALGTDGGGSIRRPAAYTGLVGLKPGIGRVARADGLPQVLLDFEVAGPITRSVRDAALLDSVLQGPDRRDPRTRAVWPEPSWPAAPRVLCVAGNAPCEPDILAALDAAADRLASLGCAVTRGPLPVDTAALDAVWRRIPEIGLAELFESDPEIGARAAPQFREIAARGAGAPATELRRISAVVDDLRSAASSAFDAWDAILTPSCAAHPWSAELPFPDRIAGQKVGPRGHAVFTGWVNAAGLPALALPAGMTESGVPIGVQLIGDWGAESALTRLGAAYEAASGCFVWPALAEG